MGKKNQQSEEVTEMTDSQAEETVNVDRPAALEAKEGGMCQTPDCENKATHRVFRLVHGQAEAVPHLHCFQHIGPAYNYLNYEKL